MASDHTIGMTTEAFSISTRRGPVGSEIEVDGQWVSTRLMAYKRASIYRVFAESDPLAVESIARRNRAQRWGDSSQQINRA